MRTILETVAANRERIEGVAVSIATAIFMLALIVAVVASGVDPQ